MCFGVIQKFLTKECPEKIPLVSSTNVDFPEEIDTYKHLLTSDYVSVTGHQRLLAVRISNIAMMCFDVSTSTSSIICFVERKRHKLILMC